MTAARNPRVPRFNTCDRCGRNAHKVAVKFDGLTTHFHNHPVFGYCPSCVKDAVEGAARQGNVWPADNHNGVVVYDRRGRKDPEVTSFVAVAPVRYDVNALPGTPGNPSTGGTRTTVQPNIKVEIIPEIERKIADAEAELPEAAGSDTRSEYLYGKVNGLKLARAIIEAANRN